MVQIWWEHATLGQKMNTLFLLSALLQGIYQLLMVFHHKCPSKFGFDDFFIVSIDKNLKKTNRPNLVKWDDDDDDDDDDDEEEEEEEEEASLWFCIIGPLYEGVIGNYIPIKR